MDPAHNSTEELSALQQPALLPIVVPPTQNRNLAARCSHPFVGIVPELLPIHSAPAHDPDPPDPNCLVFEPALLPIVVLPAQNRNFAARCSHPFVGIVPELLPTAPDPPGPVFGLCLLMLVVLITNPLITFVYGPIPAICFLFVLAIIKVIQCAIALHQENPTRRRDRTHSRTGYVLPKARQRSQERQHIPTSEEEADQDNLSSRPATFLRMHDSDHKNANTFLPLKRRLTKIICRQEDEEDETDEEIAQKVKGHLSQMFEASELASAEGISFSEALQRVSSNEQEVQEGNTSKSKGTPDA
jgi:hypothetical protein